MKGNLPLEGLTNQHLHSVPICISGRALRLCGMVACFYVRSSPKFWFPSGSVMAVQRVAWKSLLFAFSCQVMGWVNQYHDTLRDLGIEEEELGFPLSADRGIGMLTDKYIDRMRQQLNAWCTNILQVSQNRAPASVCMLSRAASNSFYSLTILGYNHP